MRRLRHYRTLAALAAVLALALPGALWAQAQGGNLEGRVIDNSGAALPGATVTVTNTATGLARVETTDADGRFRFASLPIGTYRVLVDLSGFGEVVVENVQLNVATLREIEVTLNQAAVEETITVTDEAPLLVTEPAIGAVVSQNELENLPLNGRQFANLAVLAPGTSLAVNADPTKPGQLTVALAGGIGRNVNYVMDGGDNTDDTIGGALQNFNLEAVQEFKIQTQQYKAEYGRSSGGVLTVVTKTGTNEFAGSVYGFFRDDDWAEKTATEEAAGAQKQKLSREQVGASFGGPIVVDRAHFFATYEKTDRETFYTLNTRRPTSPAGLFPGDDGSSFPTPFEDELITGKATWDVNARQLLSVRYGFQENSDKYGPGPLIHPTALGTVANEYESILGSHTAQIGSDKLNEFLYQYTSFDNLISADSSLAHLIFPGGARFGQNANTPQATHQRKKQYKDDFSWTADMGGDSHSFKAGVNYIDEPELGGDFTTGTSGQFTLLENRVDSPVVSIQVSGGFLGFSTPVEQYGAYFQDDWDVTENLTLNLGLRYDYWDGFDIDQRTNPIYQTLHNQTTFNEPYLQDFRSFDGILENDDDNFAPRIGFSWDVTDDGRHILRGGVGKFFDFPYTNATILFPAESVQSNFGTVYRHDNPAGIRNPDGSFFRPGQPLPPNQLTSTGPPVPNEIGSPTLATPYSDQISLGYSWQATNWLGLNLDVLSVDYHDIPYRFRANPFFDANRNGVQDTTERRRFPQFGNMRIWYGNGRATYEGINLGARARLAKFEMQGFYTYSEAEGNILAGADEFRLTAARHQPSFHGTGADVSINPFDPTCGPCFGPLYTDARHRVTLGGIYQGPWGINVSGVARYRSALPYTLHTNRDVTGDGMRDLAAGVSNVNSERGDEFSQVDVRLAKEFRFGDFGIELIGEVFNLFDEDNPAQHTVQTFTAAGQPLTVAPASFSGDPLQGEQRLAQFGLRLRWR